MKSSLRTIAMLVPVTLLLSACIRDDPTIQLPEGPLMSVAITAPEDGTQVPGNVVDLQVAAQGLGITPADGDTTGATGHFHVFINQDPVAPGEAIGMAAGIVHFSSDSVRIPGLAAGSHRLTVVLGDGAHNRLGSVSDTVEVQVQGPSISLSVPADAPQATGFAVDVRSEGVEIGGSGDQARQLALLIDPEADPQSGGQPIPSDDRNIHMSGTSHQVAGLAEGQHTIWVVLTDADRVPVSPLVADRAVVTIR